MRGQTERKSGEKWNEKFKKAHRILTETVEIQVGLFKKVFRNNVQKLWDLYGAFFHYTEGPRLSCDTLLRDKIKVPKMRRHGSQ